MTTFDLDAARRRIASELPPRARWVIHGTPLEFDFSRCTQPLRAPSESDIQGALEPEWLSLALFGEQDYADGGGARPLLGIDTHTGEVVGLDPERDSCLYLLNTNLEAFIRMFTLFDNFVRLGRGTVADLSSAARAIEPSSFDRSAWATLLEQLRSAPACTPDDVVDG